MTTKKAHELERPPGGGNYIRDPKTGKLKLVESTNREGAVAPPADPPSETDAIAAGEASEQTQEA